MITLPPLNPICLRSFSVAIGIFGALAAGSFFMLSGVNNAFALGAALGFVISLPGVLWPTFMASPYRAWNKLARELARWIALLLLAICFYVVLVAVGQTGSSLRLRQPEPDESLWVIRQALAPNAYKAQYPHASQQHFQSRFVYAFVSWGIHSGNFWACFLLPFIWLLSRLDSSRDHNPSTEIYTLF
jgi:hypothetical protein